MDCQKIGSLKEIGKVQLAKKEAWNVIYRIDETSVVIKKGNWKFT